MTRKTHNNNNDWQIEEELETYSHSISNYNRSHKKQDKKFKYKEYNGEWMNGFSTGQLNKWPELLHSVTKIENSIIFLLKLKSSNDFRFYANNCNQVNQIHNWHKEDKDTQNDCQKSNTSKSSQVIHNHT